MEGNEFSNGLLGHRVEGTCYKKETYQGIWVGTEIIDGAQWDRIVTDEGQIVRIDAVRVIRPRKEVVMPAEPYSIETLDDRFRLCKEILGPNGYTFQWVTESADGQGYNIWKHGESAFIGQQGVYQRSGEIVVPLNEWVKNPTIESLKPKD